jgi:hypothetical protein
MTKGVPMLKAIILNLLVSAPLIACPNLAGKYICDEGNDTAQNPTVITQEVNSDGVTVYTVYSEDTESKVIADGKKRGNDKESNQYTCLNDSQIKVYEMFTMDEFELVVTINAILTKTSDGYSTDATIQYDQNGMIDKEEVKSKCTKI